MAISSSPATRPQISLYTWVRSETLIDLFNRTLGSDRYSVTHTHSADDFVQTLVQNRWLIDCLLVEQQPELPRVIKHLHREATLLPTIFLDGLDSTDTLTSTGTQANESIYHRAEMHLSDADVLDNPQKLELSIERAIAQFLQLSSQCRLLPQNEENSDLPAAILQKNSTTQQHQLSEKLQERLGYLGIYYKRDTQRFFRNLSVAERQSFIHELTVDYQDIILNYFAKDSNINQAIDAFINKVFFADISVSQVLEIHMDLMGKFAKKLKLEGRSEDILLDYRLTLIDTVAHLCEMYRRSIPRDP